MGKFLLFVAIRHEQLTVSTNNRRIERVRPIGRPGRDSIRQRRWLELLDGETVYMGLYDGGNALVGVWPLQLNRRMGLSILIRSQFTQACGPYFAPELEASKSALENRRFFLSEMCQWLSAKRLALWLFAT